MMKAIFELACAESVACRDPVAGAGRDPGACGQPDRDDEADGAEMSNSIR